MKKEMERWREKRQRLYEAIYAPQLENVERETEHRCRPSGRKQKKKFHLLLSGTARSVLGSFSDR